MLTRERLRRAAAVLVALVISVGLAARAEDVEKRFRVGVNLGYMNPEDEIPSDAANQLTLVDSSFELAEFFVDPRDDSAVFGNLKIEPNPLITVSAQYALSKIFLVEGSIGYTKTALGKVEMQAQFDGVAVDEDLNFNFSTFRIEAGDIERVPIRLSGIARFRPRARFNPFVGAGIGYAFIGYEPSSEFNAWSTALDASTGGQGLVTSAINGAPGIIGPAPGSAEVTNLSGARVETDDTFEWHVLAGAEYTIKPNWALVLDLRYSDSSRSIEIGFNGGDDLGIAVPQLNDYDTSPAAQQTYGPVRITSGGVVDGGSLQPIVGAPPNTNCAIDATFCLFSTDHPDGVVDPGFYYINGGTLSLKSFDYTIGLRYTF